MRVLALADKRPPLDPALMAEELGVDAGVCLGNLGRAWIEPLAQLRLRRLGRHGNHDPPELLHEVEVEDLHGRRTSLGRLTVAGFEGLRALWRRRPLPPHAEGGPQARAPIACRPRTAVPLPAIRDQRRSRRSGARARLLLPRTPNGRCRPSSKPTGCSQMRRSLEAHRLLRELVGQDFEIDDDGIPRLHRGTASGRIISTVDTEMRHGRKSSSQRFDGYKLSAAATNTSEPLITAVDVAPASEQDGPQAKHLIDAQPARRRPGRLLGDSAGCAKSRSPPTNNSWSQLASTRRSRQRRAPTPDPATDRAAARPARRTLWSPQGQISRHRQSAVAGRLGRCAGQSEPDRPSPRHASRMTRPTRHSNNARSPQRDDLISRRAKPTSSGAF